jgi:glycine cleavage system regulatory protein
MTKSIVITLVGDDRPGIVEGVARIVVKHHGDWVESRMANLSGKFAGLVRINLPDEQCEAFIDALKSGEPDLKISVELADAVAATDGKSYRLELVGHNRPGIVHRITAVLAAEGATVDDMETEVTEASMSGEHLFKASFMIRISPQGDIDDLRQALEREANELIVDLELD